MKSLLLTLLMMIFALPALAQRQVYLGETNLGPRGDTDVISIRSCTADRRDDRWDDGRRRRGDRDDRWDDGRRRRGDRDDRWDDGRRRRGDRGDRWDDGRRNPRRDDGRMRAFRFMIDRAPARIRYVTLTFGNGSRQTYYPVRRYFPVGSSSRWFNIPGNERCIRSIQVHGDSEARGWPGFLAQTRVVFVGLE